MSSLTCNEWCRLLATPGEPAPADRSRNFFPDDPGQLSRADIQPAQPARHYIGFDRKSDRYCVLTKTVGTRPTTQERPVSYEKIIQITGRFMKGFEDLIEAGPKTGREVFDACQSLAYIQKRRKIHVRNQFCPLGRLLHYMCSFFKNMLLLRGWGSTEAIGDRYVNRLERLITAAEEKHHRQLQELRLQRI